MTKFGAKSKRKRLVSHRREAQPKQPATPSAAPRCTNSPSPKPILRSKSTLSHPPPHSRASNALSTHMRMQSSPTPSSINTARNAVPIPPPSQHTPSPSPPPSRTPVVATPSTPVKSPPVNRSKPPIQPRVQPPPRPSTHSGTPESVTCHPVNPPQTHRETARTHVAPHRKVELVRAQNRPASSRQAVNVLMKQTVLQNLYSPAFSQVITNPDRPAVASTVANANAQLLVRNNAAMHPTHYLAPGATRPSAAAQSSCPAPTSQGIYHHTPRPVAQLPNGYATQIANDRKRFATQCQTSHPLPTAPPQSTPPYASYPYPSHYPYLYVPMANNVSQQSTPTTTTTIHPAQQTNATFVHANHGSGQKSSTASRTKQVQSQPVNAQAYLQNIQGAQYPFTHQQIAVPATSTMGQRTVRQPAVTQTRNPAPIANARMLAHQSAAAGNVQQTLRAAPVARAQPVAQLPQTATQVPQKATASNPTANPSAMQQQAKQFSRSRVAPRPKEPTLIHYYDRLDKIVQEATEFSRRLRVAADFPHPDKNQMPRIVAYEFQGVLGSEIDGMLKKHVSDSAFMSTFASKVAGDFVEYGVSGSNLGHIADALLATPAASSYTLAPAVSPQQSHTHPIVERARVRVFEAEITHLPLSFVETLVKTRRTMRRFKSRIDLHVRIILALEGKGRKVSDAQLDRLKLQLEKADQQAENEQKRRMAAEAARLEKERRVKEAAKQSEKSAVKDKELKKRRRQENAQASFMKRFVRAKTDERPAEEHQEVQYVPRERSGHFALDVASDPNVMGVDWWLRSEIRFVPVTRLDELLKGNAGSLKDHLKTCAERREGAERNLNGVLQDYRSQRRMLSDDRYPRFVRRRVEVRGRGHQGPIKLLQFDENYRPAYFGSFRRSREVSGRRPFKKDSSINYDHDSEAEWEEEDEGEDILDVEAEKELASEEAELKILYGSDDEDDDDFLDDEDMGDDDDDDEDGEGNLSQGTDSEKEGNNTEVVDLTRGQQSEAKKARDNVKVKRRKCALCAVVVEGISLSGASKLDAYPVTAFGNSKAIAMFNPFVFTASDIAAEHLKAKVPPTRPMKLSNIDEKAKLDLAVALVNDGSNRDRIVYQFCESRRTRGLNVPAKSEVVRAISQMATREKRDGDTRAVWYLNDAHLERKVEQLGHIGQASGSSRPVSATLWSGK